MNISYFHRCTYIFLRRTDTGFFQDSVRFDLLQEKRHPETTRNCAALVYFWFLLQKAVLQISVGSLLCIETILEKTKRAETGMSGGFLPTWGMKIAALR